LKLDHLAYQLSVRAKDLSPNQVDQVSFFLCKIWEFLARYGQATTSKRLSARAVVVPDELHTITPPHRSNVLDLQRTSSTITPNCHHGRNMLKQIALFIEHDHPHLSPDAVGLYDSGDLDFLQSMISK
jgi:hypothetical protein